PALTRQLPGLRLPGSTPLWSITMHKQGRLARVYCSVATATPIADVRTKRQQGTSIRTLMKEYGISEASAYRYPGYFHNPTLTGCLGEASALSYTKGPTAARWDHNHT